MQTNEKGAILLIEESDNLRAVLRDFFEMLKFKVADFEEGISALRALSKETFDICIIDLNAKPHDGFYIMHEILKVDPDIPVILLSSKNEKDLKIRGFKEGCDDFVTKPFSIEELSLRIDAILRRTKKKNPILTRKNDEIVFYFADYLFNYSNLQLIHPTLTRTLTRKEADLLHLFCINLNSLITRQTIVKEIWGPEHEHMGRSMDVYITKLRSFLSLECDNSDQDDPEDPEVKSTTSPKVQIVNVHGTGFILKVHE